MKVLIILLLAMTIGHSAKSARKENALESLADTILSGMEPENDAWVSDWLGKKKEEVKEKINEAVETGSELVTKTEEKAVEIAQKAQETKEKAKEKAAEIAQKAQEAAENANEKAGEIAQKVKAAVEKAKEMGKTCSDKASEAGIEKTTCLSFFRQKVKKKATDLAMDAFDGLVMERIRSQDFFLKALQRVGVENPDLKGMTEEIIDAALDKIGAKIPYLDEFAKSCNKHTLCYRCAGKMDWKKKECDNRLYLNTMLDCIKPGTGGMKSMIESIQQSFTTRGLSTAKEILKCAPFAFAYSYLEQYGKNFTELKQPTPGVNLDWCEKPSVREFPCETLTPSCKGRLLLPEDFDPKDLIPDEWPKCNIELKDDKKEDVENEDIEKGHVVH